MAKTINMTDIVGEAKADRNRAVDFYKAAAMVAVAFGHWMAIAVFTDAVPHRLLEADAVGDRCRSVAGPHDVVLGFGDRAERREAVVLADGRQFVTPPGEDLVGVGLVADIPEDLVLRRVHDAVEGDRDLAGAEVGAEVAADLPDHVDAVGPYLFRDLLELVVAQSISPSTSLRAARACWWDSDARLRASSSP